MHQWCSFRVRARVRCALLVQEMRSEWDDAFDKNVGYVSQLLKSEILLMVDAEHRKHVSLARDKLRLNITTKTVTTTVPIVKEGLSLVPISETVYIAKGPKDNYVNLGMVREMEADPLYNLEVDEKLFAYISPTHKKFISSTALGGREVAAPRTSHQDEFYAPFWHVKSTAKLHEANMKFDFIKLTLVQSKGEITLPILTNHKALKANEQLFYFQPNAHCKYPDVAKGAKKQRIE